MRRKKNSKPTKLHIRQRIEKQILVNANRQVILANELSAAKRIASKLWDLLYTQRRIAGLCIDCGEKHTRCFSSSVRGRFIQWRD